MFDTVQAKDTSSCRAGEPSSVAPTVTAYGEPGSASKPTVPEITPVAGSMARPGGRPVADQASASPSASKPRTARLTAWPSPEPWAPGLVTCGGRLVSATVQLKVVESSRRGVPSSVTVMVTACGDPAAAS